MRKLTFAILTLFVAGVLFITPIKADAGVHNLTIDDVLNEIMRNHNVTSIRDLKCEDITEEEFEKLGEAVMSYMHPDEDEHNAMDEMMGGEGSESLRQAHIAMGERYLGCNSYIGMGMMGYGPSMMQDFEDNDTFSGIIKALQLSLAALWILIAVGVATLVYYVLRSRDSKQQKKTEQNTVKAKRSKRTARNKSKK